MSSAAGKNRLARARDAILKIVDSIPGLHVAVESIGDQVVITLREPRAPARTSRSLIPRGGVTGPLPSPDEVIEAIGEHYGGLTLTDVAYRFGVRPRSRLRAVLADLIFQGRLEKVVNRFRVPGTVRPYRSRKRYAARRAGAQAPAAVRRPSRPRAVT